MSTILKNKVVPINDDNGNGAETFRENIDTQRNLLKNDDEKPINSFRNKKKIEITTNKAEIQFNSKKVDLGGSLKNM